MRLLKDLPGSHAAEKMKLNLGVKITGLRVLTTPPERQAEARAVIHRHLHNHEAFRRAFERGDRVRVTAAGLMSHGRQGEVLKASSRTVEVLLDNGQKALFMPGELELR